VKANQLNCREEHRREEIVEKHNIKLKRSNKTKELIKELKKDD